MIKRNQEGTDVPKVNIPVVIVMNDNCPWIVEEINFSYEYNHYAVFKGFKGKYFSDEIDRDNTIDSIITNTGLYWTEADDTNYNETIEILNRIIKEHEKVKNCYKQKYDKNMILWLQQTTLFSKLNQ